MPNSTKEGYYIAQYKSFIFWKTLKNSFCGYDCTISYETHFPSYEEALFAVKEEINSLLLLKRVSRVVNEGRYP